MFNTKIYNLYKYINYKKANIDPIKIKKIFLKKNKKIVINKDFKIINTCIMTGRKKGVLNKTKLNRHFIRNSNKNIFNYWGINSW